MKRIAYGSLRIRKQEAQVLCVKRRKRFALSMKAEGEGKVFLYAQWTDLVDQCLFNVYKEP